MSGIFSCAFWPSACLFWRNVYLDLLPIFFFFAQFLIGLYEKGKDTTLKDELTRLLGAQYSTGEERRNSSRKNEEAESEGKQYPVVEVTGDGSKVQCCKEQYFVGTWNIRSMNQGKLEVVKWEMARVNIDSLGISELKWTGMGKFNSDNHYTYYCGQESLRRNGVALIVNKRV